MYLWTPREVEEALQGHPHPDLVRAWFRLEGAPTFEAGFLPQHRESLAVLAERFGLPLHAAREQVEQGRRALLEHRQARGLPRDEKPLTGLHGLLLSAFAELHDDPVIGAAGEELAERLRVLAARPGELSQLLDLPRDAAGAADLSDYAYLAQGLHDWAAATGAGRDRTVTGLLEIAWADFTDADGWRAAREQPLPGMVAQRFHTAVHNPSPTSLILALSQEYGDESETLAKRLAAFDQRPGRGVETSPQEHAQLILLLTRG